MKPSPSFVFFGTPDVARETLDLLKASGYVPSLIITAPDRPVGRHFTMTPPPVKEWAKECGVPYIQPEKITDSMLPDLSDYDLFVVVAYGKILPQWLIDLPKFGTVNIHYSLLPRWRGASPVEAAILHGDSETGVSLQKMVFKLDAGPIISETKIPIDNNDTTQTLRGKLIPLGVELLAEFMEQLATTPITEQDESFATHCGKIKKEDALVRLDEPDEILWNKYRAYFGWPTIYFLDEQGKRVKITKARFENKKFIIERVIPEGKKEQDY